MRAIAVKVFKDSKNPLPAYQSDGAAACDVYSNENVVIQPGEIAKVDTGLYLGIPEGWKIRVLPRSGLSSKGVSVANSPGLIDDDFTGCICVLLRNDTEKSFEVKFGDRIAQLEIEPVYRISWNQVDSRDELPKTSRGPSGFGSTGV